MLGRLLRPMVGAPKEQGKEESARAVLGYVIAPDNRDITPDYSYSTLEQALNDARRRGYTQYVDEKGVKQSVSVTIN